MTLHGVAWTPPNEEEAGEGSCDLAKPPELAEISRCGIEKEKGRPLIGNGLFNVSMSFAARL